MATFIDAIVVYIPLLVLFGPDFIGASETPDAGGSTVTTLIDIAYGTALVAIWGTTVGKVAFRGRVLTVTGERVSWGRSLGRELAKFISGFALGIGFLMVAFRSDKRGLHDLIAGTIVVQR